MATDQHTEMATTGEVPPEPDLKLRDRLVVGRDAAHSSLGAPKPRAGASYADTSLVTWDAAEAARAPDGTLPQPLPYFPCQHLAELRCLGLSHNGLQKLPGSFGGVSASRPPPLPLSVPRRCAVAFSSLFVPVVRT